MNPRLNSLHSYPFEKLAQLKQKARAPGDRQHIAMSLGEPAHPTPHFIQEALISHLHGLGNYPNTKGMAELRDAIGDWLARRFSLPRESIDAGTQILPVNGTREALFSFAQSVVDVYDKPIVAMPNPFYQIYEGAALLAGAEPYYLNTPAENAYLPDFESVPEQIWRRCQLLYICSPGNPAGAVLTQADHEKLLGLAERYDFIIASDECYTEIYADERHPPQGLLQSAFNAGNDAFKRCVVFHSLSKRSNAPGLRSGFVAGDAQVLGQYFKYRTYHGCVMPPPTQCASIPAWQDEKHVVANRELYRAKFAAVLEILGSVCELEAPPASFYLWLPTPISDTDFVKRLYERQNVTVLPGSFLSRPFNGTDPGANHVRIALVAALEECVEAARRLKEFLITL
jgi:N-succinyldiaminopimelate aminotransferase